MPRAVFEIPIVFLFSASVPTAVLLKPVVLASIADAPTATLDAPAGVDAEGRPPDRGVDSSRSHTRQSVVTNPRVVAGVVELEGVRAHAHHRFGRDVIGTHARPPFSMRPAKRLESAAVPNPVSASERRGPIPSGCGFEPEADRFHAVVVCAERVGRQADLHAGRHVLGIRVDVDQVGAHRSAGAVDYTPTRTAPGSRAPPWRLS